MNMYFSNMLLSTLSFISILFFALHGDRVESVDLLLPLDCHVLIDGGSKIATDSSQALSISGICIEDLKDDIALMKAQNMGEFKAFVAKPHNKEWAKAWNAMHDDAIPRALRTKIENLEFVTDYLRRFPNKGADIKNGLKGAVNKQNWLNLFKLEDFVKVEQLVKDDIVVFTTLEEVFWAKRYIEDVVVVLRKIRSDFGPDFGRWNGVEAGTITVNPNVHFPDIFAIASNESTIFHSGLVKSKLRLNKANLNRFDTYEDYLEHLRQFRASGESMVENVEDVLHHELGHKLTIPNNASDEFGDNFTTFSQLLEPYGRNSLVDADEALAEIFTAHRKGVLVDDDLMEFFNDYSIAGFPDIQ